MNVVKKVAIVSLVVVIGALSVGFVHVQDVAKGSLDKWDPLEYLTVEANDMAFSVNVRGDKNHTPVILLHGFPESAVMWDTFMDELAAQGYYAIAPNQRGYSSGARPAEVDAYALDYLVSDILQIADSMGIKEFHLIGHDWGAAVGWMLSAEHSERILSYAAISVPHLDAFGKAYREDPDQYESSEYIRFFQKKILPEYVLAQNDYAELRAVWDKHESEEIEHYLRIFKQENALSTALNWYRANFPAFDVGLNLGDIEVPTTFIWGNQDQALKRSGVHGTHDLVSAEYEFIEMDTGHWIIQENYEELTPHLLNHLAKHRVTQALAQK